MTSFGVPVGTTNPNHPRFSNPGSVSATAGTAGNCGERCLLVTPNARSFPCWMKLIAAARFGVENGTWPAMVSTMAGASPLYGTCTTSIFAAYRKFYAARCVWLPKPAEPYEISRGRAFARSMNSLTVFGGKVGVTTNTCGPLATLVTGTKSLAGSNGIFL